jgi:hypothetical protein
VLFLAATGQFGHLPQALGANFVQDGAQVRDRVLVRELQCGQMKMRRWDGVEV